MIKRGNFQQITKETKPGKLQSRRGWVVITSDDMYGIYPTKGNALLSISDAIAVIPIVIDFYVGDGL